MKRFVLGLGLALASACTASTAAGPAADAYQRGLDERKAGKIDRAMRELRQATQENRPLDAWRVLIQVYYEQGRLSEITNELRSRAKLAPDDPVLHYALGIALFANPASAGSEAIDEFRTAAALRPIEAEYPFREGVALLESERFAEALPLLQKAVELAPEQAKYRVPLGLCQARRGDRAGALEQFRKLITLRPTAKDVQLAQQAIAHLDDPLRDVPKSEEENVKRGIDWLNRADQPLQAIDTFQDVLDRFPALAPIHGLIGLAYERIDDSGQAVEHFRRSIELRPGAAEPYLYLADLYVAKQKPEVADEYYQKALERTPLRDRAYRMGGEAAVMQANAPAALENFRAFEALRPDDPMAHKMMATGYELAGTYDLAEIELKGVIEKDDHDVDGRIRLAYLYKAEKERSHEHDVQVRNRELAIEAFQKVLDLQPENAAASRALRDLKAGN